MEFSMRITVRVQRRMSGKFLSLIYYVVLDLPSPSLATTIRLKRKGLRLRWAGANSGWCMCCKPQLDVQRLLCLKKSFRLVRLPLSPSST